MVCVIVRVFRRDAVTETVTVTVGREPLLLFDMFRLNVSDTRSERLAVPKSRDRVVDVVGERRECVTNDVCDGRRFRVVLASTFVGETLPDVDDESDGVRDGDEVYVGDLVTVPCESDGDMVGEVVGSLLPDEEAEDDGPERETSEEN